jgi:2-polyprenyl-3-methyl-5-hydroxy-6-metoxy-1,4-benzoquinol methylase
MPPTSSSNISTKDFWSRGVPMTFEDQPKSYEEKRIFRYSLQDYMHEEYRFQDFKGKKVLEIGVGSGIDAAEFLRNGANVIGIDFSSNAIRNANLLFKEAKVNGDRKSVV